jgi:outer membrane protein assembly factor BamB
LYVHFGHMGTACLGVDGQILWRTNAVAYDPVHGAASSPVLVDGLLVFGCDGAREPFLAALDARHGALRWRTPRNATAKKTFSFATPLVIASPDGPLIVSPSSGFVGGYAAGNGQELWRVRYGEGYSVVPRPVYAQGLLFLSSGYDRPVFYAINPSGATGDCTASHVAWTATRGAPNTPSALALGDEVYTVSDAGIATCFEAKTGKIHWNERLGGDFSASPVAAEGRLYFVNEAGVGSVVAAGRSFRRLAVNALGERTLASPAVADHALLIRTASQLWRIGR